MATKKYTSDEINDLPILAVDLPQGNSLFRTGARPSKYRVEDLKKAETGSATPRTRDFEREVERIWQETNAPVPFAFRTRDGAVRSLDAGCLGFLASRNPCPIEFRTIDGYIVSVVPVPPWPREGPSGVTSGERRSAARPADPAGTPLILSEALQTGEIYSRDDLKRRFGIVDATINNGVFRPAHTASVLLFVTERKTSDRTQYQDRLADDLLYWQGQSSGRTDPLIVEHQARGLELLVFFRTEKYEHPNAAFRYLGPFEYVSHSGRQPTNFVLQARQPIGPFTTGANTNLPDDDPSAFEDNRHRTWRAIVARRGRLAFRNALLNAYGNACAISGCSVTEVLEAAHIEPYTGDDSNTVRNGLLLRTDLHTLFDYGLLWINPSNLRVEVAPSLRATAYGEFHNRPLREPISPHYAPRRRSVKLHYDRCCAAHSIALGYSPP